MLEKSGFNFQLHCHPTLQQWETATSEDKRLHTTHQPFLEAHVTEFGMCRIVLPSLRKRGGKERVCEREQRRESARRSWGTFDSFVCLFQSCERAADGFTPCEFAVECDFASGCATDVAIHQVNSQPVKSVCSVIPPSDRKTVCALVKTQT